MAQPPSYNRKKNFADDFGNETDHSSLNAELDRASNSINDIRTNLAILQADDGKLRPSVVTADSISEELRVSLVEGVVMDAQTMLDRSLAAADASSASAFAAKTSETSAAGNAVKAANSARDAAKSAQDLHNAVNPDWNLTQGPGEIRNKPTTLKGYGIADGVSKMALKTRFLSTAYSVGEVVVAPYVHDAMLVCTTAGTTSDQELGEDTVKIGVDVEDGSVVWNVRKKFTTGLKTTEGSISLDAHASQTGEFGLGNPQYFGHVKVIDDVFTSTTAEHSIALSPFAVKEMINNIMLGKSAGVMTVSQDWVCPVSGTYTITLVGGGGGGGGGWNGGSGSGGYAEKFHYFVNLGASGGGGGCGSVASSSVYIEKDTVCNVIVGAGGAGGGTGAGGGSGGATSFTAGETPIVAPGGGGATVLSRVVNTGIFTLTQYWGGAGQSGNSAKQNAMDGVYPSPASQSNVSNIPIAAGCAGGRGASVDTTISNLVSYGNGGGGGAGGGTAYASGGAAVSLASSGAGTGTVNAGSGGSGAQGAVFIQLDGV